MILNSFFFINVAIFVLALYDFTRIIVAEYFDCGDSFVVRSLRSLIGDIAFLCAVHFVALYEEKVPGLILLVILVLGFITFCYCRKSN